MPFGCRYEFCEEEQRMIPANESVACSICGNKKDSYAFHKNCFEKHNQEKHSGKAIMKNRKELV